MKIDIRVEDHSKEAIEAKNRAVKAALEAIGLHLEGESKEELENSPRRIDTGLLRNSIAHAVSGNPASISSYSADKGDGSGSYSGSAPDDPPEKMAVYWGTNVEYAQSVHEGTQRMAPNRFIKNAYERNKDQIRQFFEKHLKSV